MSGDILAQGPMRDPIEALVSEPDDAVMAVIVGVEGPSYRPYGAVMAVLGDKRRVGSLSSGCIEADIAVHGRSTLQTGVPRVIRYGRGSPFVDIRLPCGGGLDILLVPRPDPTVLRQLAEQRAARRPCALTIDETTGAMRLEQAAEPGRRDGHVVLAFQPELRFLTFGKGPEASTFAALVRSAGFPGTLFSPDRETLDFGRAAGCDLRHLKVIELPSDATPDPWSAVVVFFHDHELEPPILARALDSDAFYVGAQGSRRARDARHLELAAMGVPADRLARLRGPIGLVPSVRDARTLAVSVLAEVLQAAIEKGLLAGRGQGAIG